MTSLKMPFIDKDGHLITSFSKEKKHALPL